MPDSQQGDDLDAPIWTDDALLGFLDHHAPSVRLWALERLLMIGSEEKDDEAVIKGLQDSNRLVVEQALDNVHGDIEVTSSGRAPRRSGAFTAHLI